MNKRTLDLWGGVGSILAAVVCVWFALGHEVSESIWKVWVAFAVLLACNGVLMIFYARRPTGK